MNDYDTRMGNAENEEISPLEEGIQLELPPRPPIVTKTNIEYESEYRSMEELGKGKFGVVKRCERKSDKSHFAAKFIKKTAVTRDEVAREVEMMNKLHHRRLISLYDAFETRNEMIVIMELVTGGELFEKVAEDDNLTEKQVIRYIKQVLYAVQHMHKKSMVHLDLKPENILCLVGEKPGYEEIKLIDFGMTRITAEGDKKSVLCGTPEFVAPEVIKYDPVTLSADMWSIGVIVYVLLSGLSPFMGDDVNETLANVCSGQYDFEDDEDDEEEGVFSCLSDEVKQFIRELLVLDPIKRLTVDESLNHIWVKTEGREKKLDIANLKGFNARRRWQKMTNMIKAVSRLSGGLSLFTGKQRTHGHKPGTFVDKVSAQNLNEVIEEEKQRAQEG